MVQFRAAWILPIAGRPLRDGWVRLDRGRVRRMLEWQIEYQQVIAPRRGQRSVVGSGDAIEHILERGAEHGLDFDPVDVAEVIAADVEYLLSIGAVGSPVDEGAA